MRLPHRDKARVSDAKVRDYLLSHEHLTGAAKARFFAAMGYRRQNWQELRRALISLAQEDVAAEVATSYGMKYIIHGMIDAPNRRVALTTVWILETGSEVPQFITAYPMKKAGGTNV